MSKKKNTTTPTPHDAAFRSFLANPDVARDFLELHLPAEYRQLCDLSTLKLEPATFVEHGLLASVNIDGPTLIALRQQPKILRQIEELPWLRFELVEALMGCLKTGGTFSACLE